MDRVTGAEAIERIEREFPEIQAELRDETWNGLLHVQIGVFSHLAQAAIDAGDRLLFGRICGVFLDLFTNGEAELVNALNVSFPEQLSFTDGRTNRRWGYGEMPAKMRAAYDAMEEYNRRLHGGG